MDKIFIIGVMSLVAVVMVVWMQDATKCNNRGGRMVQAPFGWECVKVVDYGK